MMPHLIHNEPFDELPEELYEDLYDSDSSSDEIVALMEAGLSYEEAYRMVQDDEYRDEWPGS